MQLSSQPCLPEGNMFSQVLLVMSTTDFVEAPPNMNLSGFSIIIRVDIGRRNCTTAMLDKSIFAQRSPKVQIPPPIHTKHPHSVVPNKCRSPHLCHGFYRLSLIWTGGFLWLSSVSGHSRCAKAALHAMVLRLGHIHQGAWLKTVQI